MAKRQGKKRKPAPTARIGLFATPERRHKMGGVITEIIDSDATGKAVIKRQRIQIECALDAYLQANKINPSQHAAGVKFRRKFLRFNNGGIGWGYGSMAFIDCGRSNAEERLNVRLDRKSKLDKVCALLTPAQQTIVERVCGYDKFIHSAQEMTTLVQALDILAVHWAFA